MTRRSAIVLIVLVTALAPSLSFAQGGASPRGTNSARTAQSGGARHRNHNADGGLGTGHAKAPGTPSADAVIQQENKLLERKLNSICRGC